MTSRHIGGTAIVVGLALAAWAWIGVWPLGPAVHSGSDYAAISGVGLAIAIGGVLTAIAGAFLLFVGRGGPDDWGR